MTSSSKINCFLIFLIISIVSIACKKNGSSNTKDQTPPVITLNGSANDTISLSLAYIDAGATALDNKDGDISGRIVIGGDLDLSTKGNHTREYSVKDNAGNSAMEIRRINVVNDLEYLGGNYSAYCVSKTAITSGSASPQTEYLTFTVSTISAVNVNNKILLNYYPNKAFSINLTLANDTLIPDLPLVGIGSIAKDKKSFSVNTIENSEETSSIRTCNCKFTRQ